MKRLILTLACVATWATGARAQIDGVVLDSLQYTAFRYFWDEANPSNGLIRDRSTSGSPCSIASTGFGLSAICIAADHGWVTRDAARTRVLTTLQTFWNGPQGSATSGVIGYKGLYYHFLDMNTALRFMPSTWDPELSTIDTALLFAGMLDAREYFNGVHPNEVLIRALADSIYRRADWDFMRNSTPGIGMGWKPSTGFQNFGKWTGYNEAMILYVLAIGSPTHPVPGTDWNVWTSNYNWSSPFPLQLPAYATFAPLFGHQYSHCWIDFRYTQDAYMRGKGSTYFQNSRLATLAQIEYARINGLIHSRDESDSLWGFTASDGPVYSGHFGYDAHGAPNGFDDGTITPTAPISSLPFAADSVWPCIRNLYTNYRVAPLWGKYGFTDAFNPVSHPWVDTDWLGIDQGPIVMMIENYRTGAVWPRFMGNADVQRGMLLAGFQSFPAGVGEPVVHAGANALFDAQPTPFHGSTTIRFRLAQPGRVRLEVFDLLGRKVATLVDEPRAAGEHSATLDGTPLAAGIYHVRLDVNGERLMKKAVLLQ